MKSIITVLFIILFVSDLSADTDANIFGDVQSNGEHLIYVTIEIPELRVNTVTDRTGHYKFINLKPGEYLIRAKMIGYETLEKKVKVESGKTIEVNFEMLEKTTFTKEVVVTGTRSEKAVDESAVKVDVINASKIEKLQASALSEALNYIPGLRLEVDCQTCNYSQLRMNGLGGAYSQILINGKSLFSPLTGLYGLEQIPANMIERIEVVKGGGSALYGSSSVGGTVNIITKTPTDNNFSLSTITNSIDGVSSDNQLLGNLAIMNDNRKAGLSLFASKRERAAYDHNGDGYSEIPMIENNSFGINAYLRPTFNHKIDINFSSIYEFRRGGNKNTGPAHEADQSEERDHNVFMGSVEYDYFFNDFYSSVSSYIGVQSTKRKHYTGIMPDIIGSDSSDFLYHFLNPPYGYTKNSTIQAGAKLNHYTTSDYFGLFDASLGFDYIYDDIFDEIKAYDYEIDQITRNLGVYGQVDWKILYNLNLLAGARVDKHNLVDDIIINPRVSLLWDIIQDLQYRIAWGTGFRAPQAFDADMHIAFAGGGIQKIILSDDLTEETSQSITSSITYDIYTPKVAAGFTLDGFFTSLTNAFVLEEIGSVDGNSILEKINGGNSTVYGVSLELRANYSQNIQFESSFTVQESKYDEAVAWSEELPGETEYLRTPSTYGFATLSYNLDHFSIDFSSNYTGSMLIPHYGVTGDAGTPENDELYESDPFFDLSAKVSYEFEMTDLHSHIEVFAGIKNMLNSFQDDFDKGKYRDSGYIYGPSLPRTIYLGLKFSQ